MLQIRTMSDEKRKERVWRNCIPEPNTGCWLWTGSMRADGYGRMGIGGTEYLAHRLSYEAFVGMIPEGLELDHTCRVRSCVNPDHLEAVTHGLNCQRGQGGQISGQQMLAKTHCPRGHPYVGENLYINFRGARVCRTCVRRVNRICQSA